MGTSPAQRLHTSHGAPLGGHFAVAGRVAPPSKALAGLLSDPAPGLLLMVCPPSLLEPDHYSKGYVPRIPGERLSASYINHYKANGGAVISKVGDASTLLVKCRPGHNIFI